MCRLSILQSSSRQNTLPRRYMPGRILLLQRERLRILPARYVYGMLANTKYLLVTVSTGVDVLQ